jgi:exopolysaccharide production protein ExoZ
MRKVAPFLVLDAWRGFAAVWVVMSHCCLAFLGTGDNAKYIHNPIYAFSIWGQLGVVIFFIISGYCIMGAAYSTLAAGRTAGRYALDRIRRIYPPYLAAILLTLAMGQALSLAQKIHILPPIHHQGGGATWTFWFTNVFLVHYELDQPTLMLISWSLCYEIVFYMILGFLLLIAARCIKAGSTAKGLQIFQTGIFALTLISQLWLLIDARSCPFPLDRWYQFGLGSLLFLMYAAEPGPLLRNARIQIGIAAALTVLLIFGTPPPREPDAHMQAITCLLFLGALCLLRPIDEHVAHNRVLRPMMWLGTISYSLYLVHPIFLAFPDVGGRRLGFDHGWYPVTFFLQLGVAIFAGWLFFLFVERHFISARQKKRVEVELSEPAGTPAAD